MRRTSSATLTLGLCTVIVACGPRGAGSFSGAAFRTSSSPGAGTRAPIQSSFVAGHLYVSAADYSLQTAPVMRYPLSNGVPASKPDLLYPSLLLPTFAVGADGTLYGLELTGGSEPYAIVVFQPNSNKPARRIVPPQPYLTNYPAITGRGGYTYVGFSNTSASPRARRVTAGSPPTLCTFNGILVYGPNARGHDAWTTCFATTYATNENVLWMSLDVHGNLYVPTLPDGIDVYAHPTTNPALIRSMTGGSFHGTYSVADDGQGDVYVLGTVRPLHGAWHSYVATYQDTASGKVKALRTVRYPTNQVWQGNVAVDDRYLYVGGYQEVLVYDKLASGPQLPLAVLPVPAAMYNGPSIAVGP
jgi:hypothetical protein